MWLWYGVGVNVDGNLSQSFHSAPQEGGGGRETAYSGTTVGAGPPPLHTQASKINGQIVVVNGYGRSGPPPPGTPLNEKKSSSFRSAMVRARESGGARRGSGGTTSCTNNTCNGRNTGPWNDITRDATDLNNNNNNSFHSASGVRILGEYIEISVVTSRDKYSISSIRNTLR